MQRACCGCCSAFQPVLLLIPSLPEGITWLWGSEELLHVGANSFAWNKTTHPHSLPLFASRDRCWSCSLFVLAASSFCHNVDNSSFSQPVHLEFSRGQVRVAVWEHPALGLCCLLQVACSVVACSQRFVTRSSCDCCALELHTSICIHQDNYMSEHKLLYNN